MKMNYYIWLFVFSAFMVSCQKDDTEIIPDEDGIRKELRLENFMLSQNGVQYKAVDSIGEKITFCVPQSVDAASMTVLFDNKDDTVFVRGKKMESGISVIDFSNIGEGVEIELRNCRFQTRKFRISVVNTDLPVVIVNTPEKRPIQSKEEWIADTHLKIWQPNEGLTYSDTTSIKGRGNITWTNYPKKPYALKLKDKAGLLGLTKHKRFCLLALYHGYLGNYYMAEVSKRAPNLEWVPEGKYVELVLNGKFQGLYYLSEQIKVDKNRVNIAKMKPTDVGGQI